LYAASCKSVKFIFEGEHRLKVFENEVMKKIYGPTTGEITRDLKKMHNEELRKLCFTPNIVRLLEREL